MKAVVMRVVDYIELIRYCMRIGSVFYIESAQDIHVRILTEAMPGGMPDEVPLASRLSANANRRLCCRPEMLLCQRDS